jgi:hypothetical protein
MTFRRVGLAGVVTLVAACSAQVIDGNGGGATLGTGGASGGRPAGGATASSGGASGGTTAAAGGAAGAAQMFSPEPGGAGGTTGAGGTGSATDAATTSSRDAAEPIVQTGCEVLPKSAFAVPGAGSGERSHCAARTCAGTPVGADLSNTWTEVHLPDAYAGCTTIEGSLVVSRDTSADLSVLACLERVTGDVLVWQNDGLTTLHGLESLMLVDGTFSVGYLGSLSATNRGLTSFSALQSLQVVGGDLFIDADPLTTLAGLDALVAVGGDLAFHLWDSLQVGRHDLDLSGLGSLQVINGGLTIDGGAGLARISGLRALRTLGKDLAVSGAPDLGALSLPALACIGGNVMIQPGYLQPNTSLHDVGPFPSLSRIRGWVSIVDEPALASVDLNAVRSVEGGTLRISGNPRLTRVGLGALSIAADDVVVSTNPALLECPSIDLGARLARSGWTHHLVVDGDLSCSAGMACVGPACG